MMTPQEFSTKIKQKYPNGVSSDGRKYADIPDVELAKKVIAKYPVYATQVNFREPQEEKGFLGTNLNDSVYGKIIDNSITRGIQNFIPGSQLGKIVGSTAQNVYQGVKNVSSGKGFFEDNSADSGVTPTQAIGDAVSAVANVAGFKGVGTVGSLGSKVAKSAGIGAAVMGGDKAAEGGTAGEIAKSSALGGVTGGALSAGTSAIESTLKALPERFVQSALGLSKKDILAKKGLEKYVIDNKKIGTTNSLYNDSQNQIQKLNTIIDSKLKSVPITQKKITTSSILDDLVKSINSQGGQITKAEAKEIIDKLAPQARGLLNKPSMSLVTANKLRQSIDRTLGDRGFLTAELPFNKEILRSFTNALRESVKSNAPEGTRAAFNSLSKEIRLSDALANKMAKGGNNIVSLTDFLGGGVGGVAGLFGGGIPGVIAGAAVARGLKSTPVLTGAAVGADAIQKILPNLSPAARSEVLQLISALDTNQK